MFLLVALLAVGMGALVYIVGQERRAKIWFVMLCIAVATAMVGAWLEINLPEWSLFAARINMTSGLLVAIASLMSVRKLYGLPLRVPAVALMITAAALNIGTIWLTQAYFSGEVIRYSWGVIIGANPNFVITPVLIAMIMLWAVANLWSQYRTAHPLDRNRAKYLFLAHIAFPVAALDFLLHFRIDLFGGPISAISTPVFLVAYGYAMLRYRLFDFRAFVGRTTGCIFAGILLVASYALVLELGRRFSVSSGGAHVAAAVLTFALWLVLARQMPAWVQRLLSNEPDFMAAVNRFSDDVVALQDQKALEAMWATLCATAFAAGQAYFVDKPQLPATLPIGELLEREPLRRAGSEWPPLADDAELLFPLRRNGVTFGALAVGTRHNGRVYPKEALDALRLAAKVFSAAMANIAAAAEIEMRHRLDRYLPPQVSEAILAGGDDAIERKHRTTITVFFSDLRRFSDLADRLDPDVLTVVMNEYLAEMSDVAFSFGGTVDKFVGDAVMVLFGAPMDLATSEQARQCVAMACEMHKRTAILNNRWRQAGLLSEDLIARMGIHTGEATVGAFGSRTRVEYTALGRSVNLASRLEGACEPGRILVSAQTWNHLRGSVSGKYRGAIRVKGFADAVEVYEIGPEKMSSQAFAASFGKGGETHAFS